MRSWLMLACLVAVTASGCLGDDDGAVPVTTESAVPGEYLAHPMYGFLTNANLAPAMDGVTRVVEGDHVHWYKPAHAGLPEVPSSLTAGAHVDSDTSAGGIAIFGPLAIMGGRSSGPLQVVDISDPASPTIVGEAADVPVRDADFIVFRDGRAVVITTSGGADMLSTDVTDPTNPTLLAQFETGHGNHNIAVVPGTPIVYNSGSGGVIDIVSFLNPENPVKLGELVNDFNCHDITFYIDPVDEKYRAYCAGYPETQIWDITNPAEPEIIQRISYPGVEQGLPLVGDEDLLPDSGIDFPISFSHLAMVSHDANVLIVGDETGGGAINGCDVYVAGESGPLGNLWFYDISDEMNPILLSHLSPSFLDAVGVPSPSSDPTDPTTLLDVIGSCTAHFGRLVEDTGFLVMGFYTAGVVLVDFTDPSSPTIADRLDVGGNVWDVQYHQGMLYTGDISRGMDVISIA